MLQLPPDDTVAEAVTASTEAVVGLQEALTAAGVTLPSLGIDLASCTSLIDPRPLVELGRCNLDTAQALAEAPRKAIR